MRNSFGLVGFLVLIFFISGRVADAGDEEWIPLKDLRVSYPQYIVGTNQKGKSNITEPRPVTSQYLDVDAGGIILVKQGAGFFLKVSLIRQLPAKAHFKIEYPNPKDSQHPLVNEMEHDPNLGGYLFASPDVVWGLKGYGTYEIKVYVYAHRGDTEPIDVLKQNILRYADTQTLEVLIFKNVLKTLLKR